MYSKNKSKPACLCASRLTHSINQHVLFVMKHVDGFVGDRHADKQPLVLGSHHRPIGLQRTEMLNELYFIHCREKP